MSWVKQLFSRHPLLRVTIPKRIEALVAEGHPVRRPMRLLAASLGI
jgi:hypothetical protein